MRLFVILVRQTLLKNYFSFFYGAKQLLFFFIWSKTITFLSSMEQNNYFSFFYGAKLIIHNSYFVKKIDNNLLLQGLFNFMTFCEDDVGAKFK